MEELTCPNCSTKNPTSNKYCTRCGQELPKISAPVAMDHSYQEKIQALKKSNKNKNKVGIIIGIVVFCMLAVGAYFLLDKFNLFDQVLTQAAQEVNKSCPKMIDNETQLDNVEVLTGKTMQYNYTLINYEKSELNVDTLKKYLEPSILENIKTNPSLAVFRKIKTTMIYNYRDKAGAVIWNYKVTPEMYK